MQSTDAKEFSSLKATKDSVSSLESFQELLFLQLVKSYKSELEEM